MPTKEKPTELENKERENTIIQLRELVEHVIRYLDQLNKPIQYDRTGFPKKIIDFERIVISNKAIDGISKDNYFFAAEFIIDSLLNTGKFKIDKNFEINQLSFLTYLVDIIIGKITEKQISSYIAILTINELISNLKNQNSYLESISLEQRLRKLKNQLNKSKLEKNEEKTSLDKTLTEEEFASLKKIVDLLNQEKTTLFPIK